MFMPCVRFVICLRHFDGFGRHIDGDYGYSPYYDPPPCPAYRPVEASQWRETSDGQLAMHFSLPSVRPGAHRIWLDEDGSLGTQKRIFYGRKKIRCNLKHPMNS